MNLQFELVNSQLIIIWQVIFIKHDTELKLNT